MKALPTAIPVLLLLSAAACVAPREARAPAPPPPAPVAQRVTEAPERAEFALEGAITQGGVAIGTAPSHTVELTLGDKPIPLEPDGRFLIAFDRDAKREAVLVATLADGRKVTKALDVRPREWDIEHVGIRRGRSRPDPDYERIRSAEVAQINAARAHFSVTDGWRQRFIWPVTGRISGMFGSQRIYAGGEAGAYHSGVDIAGKTGTPILAPADGVVVLATPKPFSLEGNLLIIDHGQGLNSAFLHMSRIDVRPGQAVKRGQVVGAIGSTGRSTGPHLHWSMKWRQARIDPQLLAGPMPGQAGRPPRVATDD